jgi:ribosome modulation factor
MIQKIWLEGLNANYTGVERNENPYIGTTEEDDWLWGWDEAEETKDMDLQEEE